MKRKVIQFYQNYLFWIFIIGILGVKILLAGLFSSDYSDRMFLPFVSMFLENWGVKTGIFISIIGKINYFLHFLIRR